jgi:hypothetical protein
MKKASETAAKQLKQGHGPKGKGSRPEERTGHKEKSGKIRHSKASAVVGSSSARNTNLMLHRLNQRRSGKFPLAQMGENAIAFASSQLKRDR